MGHGGVVGEGCVWLRAGPLAFSSVFCRVCWVHLLVCTVWLRLQNLDRRMPGLEGVWWVFRGLLPHPKYIMQ